MEVGRLHRFGIIGGDDADAIFRWVELQRRADAIRGLPQRTTRSPSHDPAMRGRSEPQARPVTATELDALEAADEACKALVREASAAALEALRAVALCDLPPSSQDQTWHLRAAARALVRHWSACFSANSARRTL